MKLDVEELYKLLPAIYRIRDEQQKGELKALLVVIAEQVAVLDEDLEQLYDDQFIETCAPWVVPYVGDLIGYRALHTVVPGVSNPRAEVANTIAYRRRKGTVSMLEQLAYDVTGWPAKVVEYFQLLATTQYLNHLRPGNLGMPDLRLWEPLERIGTAFEQVAHTMDVRCIARRRGRFNIPSIGIFLWRLESYPLTLSPAAKLDDRRYFFSPLGLDTQLFTHPDPETDIMHLAGRMNVPNPIHRRVLDAYLADYYGSKKSLLLTVDGKPVQADADHTLGSLLAVCDLSDVKDAGGTVIGWAHKPKDKIAIDPVLGRIAFPESAAPPEAVQVSYHYGFSADMGGGEYERAATIDQELTPVWEVPATGSIQAGLDHLISTGSVIDTDGAVEITDSGRYEENPVIRIRAGHKVELRAGNGHRPALILGGARPELKITVEPVSRERTEITLNGLLIAGGGIRITGDGSDAVKRVVLRHCTLVPAAGASLIVTTADIELELDCCITGGLSVDAGAKVKIRNSIVDASQSLLPAFAGPDDEDGPPIGKAGVPGGELHIENSTVTGRVSTRLLRYASNSIFMSRVTAARLQEGCVRFCYLPLASRVPRRYRCQPDFAFRRALGEREQELGRYLYPGEKKRILEAVLARLVPVFTDRFFGRPGYAQLDWTRCAVEIRTGADDGSEMGAFHDLYQPQRETNLRVRLEEYLRFGLAAGIIYET